MAMFQGAEVTDSSRPAGQPAPPVCPAFIRIVAGLLCLAAGFTAVTAVLNARRTYGYDHGWSSAAFSTIARAYVRHGVFQLGFVPVQNNDPLAEPDVYIHWPPLFPLTVAGVFSVFGESEASAHTLMLFLVLLNAALIYYLCLLTMSRVAAIIAAFAFLTLPNVVGYAHLVETVSPGSALMLAALIGFQKSAGDAAQRWWRRSGYVFLAAAAATNWESGLAGFGLLAAAWVTRNPGERAMAWRAILVSAATAAVILGWYAIHSPAHVTDLLEVVRYRAGLSPQYTSHLLLRNAVAPHLGLLERIGLIAAHTLHMWGLVALGALVYTWHDLLERVRAHRYPAWFGAFAAFLAGGILWGIAMSNHMAIHEYQQWPVLPAGAMAMGWAGAAVLERLSESRDRFLLVHGAALVLALGAYLMLPSARALWHTVRHSGPEGVATPGVKVEFGWDIKRNTPQGSVVVTPEDSMVPVYYSERHVVRAILDDADLASVLPEIKRLFGAYPLYLAIPRGAETSFAATLRSHPVMTRTARAAFVKLW